MEIHLIWAQEHDWWYRKNNQLPWHIPEDLKNFKKITLNSTIVMGEKLGIHFLLNHFLREKILFLQKI